MRAPTPVSSLVHSSTLVAGGVWFLTCFGCYFSLEVIKILIILSIFTVLSRGICALFFIDIKKIVALSTCNNIAWCVIYYCLGNTLLCIIQLVSHGVAKCLLFIGVGDVLSGSHSSQKYNVRYKVFKYSLSKWLGVSFLTLIISGVPFKGVFFSKHLLVRFKVLKFNLIILSFLLVCILVSYLYSGRLWSLLRLSYNGINKKFKNIMFYICYFIFISSLFNYFSCGYLVESDEIGLLIRTIILLFQSVGLYIGFLLTGVNTKKTFIRTFLGQDVLLKYFFNTWLVLV